MAINFTPPGPFCDTVPLYNMQSASVLNLLCATVDSLKSYKREKEKRKIRKHT